MTTILRRGINRKNPGGKAIPVGVLFFYVPCFEKHR